MRLLSAGVSVLLSLGVIALSISLLLVALTVAELDARVKQLERDAFVGPPGPPVVLTRAEDGGLSCQAAQPTYLYLSTSRGP